MCWPRSFCCRCPAPSSFAWSPSMTFGRTPRRPALAQTSFPWRGWLFAAQNYSTPPPPVNNTPPPNPVIPRRRRVQFGRDNPPPFIPPSLPVIPPLGPWPPPPIAAHPLPLIFAPSPPPPTPFWPQQQQMINPELRSPRGTFPYLDWDLTQFASSARLRTSGSPRSHPHDPPAFDSPAIFPHTQLIAISYADTPVLLQWETRWGPIFARGQGTHPVTIENVLDAIYQYFSTPLGPADRAAMSAHAWGLVSDAYYRRLDAGRSPNLRAYDVARGACRVDILGGATKFGGLQCVGQNYLRLVLSPY
ncbi:hypothetical protein MVEN_00179300 [Mycena venus]|uniref:DUF6699 domain-containing protein n=1 Tax=Mycena venus TaxID=2733690 RepID=A0A8H7DBQ1_9AGAR|nr:hypothetical protein MVEN_00179300 [Mycena venus]